MRIIKRVTLDLNRDTFINNVTIHQGEADSRVIEALIMLDGNPFIIPETYTASVSAVIDGKIVAKDIECEITEKSVVIIPITKFMAQTAGDLTIELTFTENGSIVRSQTLPVTVLESAVEGATEYDEEYEEDIIAREGLTLIDRTTGESSTLFTSDNKLHLDDTTFLTDDDKKEILEKIETPEGATIEVDQSYDSSSENAQSGFAVAEAISLALGDVETLLSSI